MTWQKRCVFRRRLKVPSVSDAVTLNGKVFQLPDTRRSDEERAVTNRRTTQRWCYKGRRRRILCTYVGLCMQQISAEKVHHIHTQHSYILTLQQQESQLSQRGRAIPRVVEYFGQSLKAALSKRINMVTFANNLVFLSTGDAVRPIALNFAWTERHCHACKTPRSMYPSIYNSFPVIRTTIAKNRHFYVSRPSFFVCPGDAPVAIT